MSFKGILCAAAALALAGASFGQSNEKFEKPKPGPEHKRLEIFVGTWKGEADIKASPFGPAGKMTYTETCEWFPGGFAVTCRSTGSGPMGESKGLSILGYSPEEKFYTFSGVDSDGWMSSAHGTVQDGTWTYTSEEKMGGKVYPSHYTIRHPSPGTATFTWEVKGDDGQWTKVMEGKSSRAAP